VKVFFDNCTSPVFAGCLNALIQGDGDEARHVRSMPEYGFAHDSDDVQWIAKLAADNAVWIVITGDGRIRRNLAERTAWVRAGLKGFVLAPAYHKTQVHQCASILLWRWPEMKSFIASAAAGSMFELPINRQGGFIPLPVETRKRKGR
jgi:PIN like domain